MSSYIDIDHVGMILKDEFMEPLGLSMNALAHAIDVPANYIHGIVHGTRGISTEMDLRLTRYFGLSQGYFLRIQTHYDMVLASRNISIYRNTAFYRHYYVVIQPYNKTHHL